jgi:predicted ThiF/HesA family dinucleotide-utilizing enzyme
MPPTGSSTGQKKWQPEHFRFMAGGYMSEVVSIEELERQKAPWGEVTLVGLGRLGLRTALTLMQAHRGGPRRIVAVDGQIISPDDLIFRTMGGEVGDYKTKFFQNLAPAGFSKEITGIASYVTDANMADLIAGDVICIEIAGGDTLPLTTKIIRHAQQIGAITISTIGVFGVDDAPVSVTRIEDADPENPIVQYLLERGVRNHILVGTGKLIRDWEPVIPPVLDRVSLAISSEILRQLHQRRISSV